MRAAISLTIVFSIAVSFLATDLHAQRGQRSSQSQRSRENNGRDRRSSGKERFVAPLSVYKAGTDRKQVAAEFEISGFQWPQPDGQGSAITLTYSYSNLLDDQMRGLTDDQLKQAVEESLALWASVAPIHFVEVADSGPSPTRPDPSYSAADRPQIRIGAHLIDGATGNTLAHTFLPFSNDDGIAGDVHFDNGENWSDAEGGFFLEVCLHELGHSLGLDHESEVEAIMNPFLAGRFDGLGDGFLLQDDIDGIRAIYGEGTGSVTPLDDSGGDDPDSDDPRNDDPDGDANGVTASFVSDGNTIMLTGDNNANTVVVSTFGWIAIVAGLDNTPINGKEAELFFAIGGTNLDCNLRGGSDQLYLVGLSAKTAICRMDEGDDALIALFSSIDEFTADGGNGNDLLLRLFSSFGETIQSAFEFAF